MAGDQHQLRRAALNDAVKGGEQRLDFALTAVQLFRNHKAIWPVTFSQREVVNATLAIAVLETAAKIVFHPSCGLITLLRSLGKQPKNYCRDRARNILTPFGRRQRLFGN